MKDSIIFKKCKNLKVSVNYKVNKLIFFNCHNIVLKCSETISGIEIEKCSSFKMEPLDPYLLNLIHCYKSSIEFILDKNIKLNTFQIVNEYSNITISSQP